MQDILKWGIAIIESVQSYRTPALDAIFQVVTFFGDEVFYLIAFPFILWCINRRLGMLLGLMTLSAAYVNLELKELIQQPRPYQLAPHVAVITAESYGMPSGHAQISIVFWGLVAHELKQSAAWIAAGFVSLIIGFSRVYLGVHFPTDVIAGWILGAMLLAFGIAAFKKNFHAIEHTRPTVLVLIFVILPIILFFVDPSSSVAAALGTLSGAGLGFILSQDALKNEIESSLSAKTVNFLLGIVGLFLIYAGLKALFPTSDFWLIEDGFRFIRYWFCGLWIVWGAPKIFDQLQLAK